jgi:hypothetical protein
MVVRFTPAYVIRPKKTTVFPLTVLKNFFFFNFYLGYIGQESDFNTVLG